MHKLGFFTRAALLAAAASLAPASSAAAQPRQDGFSEIAADMAFGFCPLFLADEFPLTSPELGERGFATAIQKQANPRFGELQTVSLKRAEGEIGFGGSPGKFCSVVIMGTGRDAALAHLREAMSYTGLDFKPAAQNGPQIEGITVEAFKASVEGQFLNLQLIRAGGPTPMVMAQMFVTEE
jgi:hypothetical protein